MAHPLVKAALDAFPGSIIDAVRELKPASDNDLPASPGDGDSAEEGA